MDIYILWAWDLPAGLLIVSGVIQYSISFLKTFDLVLINFKHNIIVMSQFKNLYDTNNGGAQTHRMDIYIYIHPMGLGLTNLSMV